MSWDINDFITDLETLQALIKKHDVPIKTTAITGISNLGSRLNQSDNTDLSHVIEDIQFELDEAIAGTFPSGVGAYIFSLTIHFILNPEKTLAEEDPFFDDKQNFRRHESIDAYSFQLEIEGLDDENEYINCWHLDRHSGTEETKVVHPFYHFQNGGNKIDDHTNTGSIVLPSAPRLPHPPMDLFLGIHFIICNFYNKNSSKFVKLLLNDREYVQIIERAQDRMWKPYYSVYNGGGYSEYAKTITPLYTIH